jgi:hypothetical protein
MVKREYPLIGQKFNRLTVVNYISKKDGYLCECECGNKTKARSSSLKSGRHASCGCLQKELLANRNNKPDFIAFKNEIYKNYSKAAKKRNYDFELTKEEFIKLIGGDCFYCGLKPNTSWVGTKRTIIDTSAFKYNGVDRKDNNIGYTTENCVSCCKLCNNSKNTLATEEWLLWVKRLYEFQNLKTW